MSDTGGRGRGAIIHIRSPLAGETVSMAGVNDPAFSRDILGRGVAIRPSAGRVVAPADGIVTQMFDTGHIVSLLSTDGIRLLVHVGLDTIRLDGAYYTARAHSGEAVKAGDVLMEFDLEGIAAAGYDTVTPVVVLDGDKLSLEVRCGQRVNELDAIMRIWK